MSSIPVTRLLQASAPSVMGILNITPDSFADGCAWFNPDTALEHVRQMLEAGVDIIDIGGESTRPGAVPVSEQEEIDRVIPVITRIREFSDIPISIDTSKPAVMREAVQAGAQLINDVTALQSEGALELAVSLQVPVCLMHMQGRPQTMQAQPAYQNVVEEVKSFLLGRVAICQQAGIPSERLLLDPGFGFGKTLQHNLLLLRHLDQLTETGFPILIGISRKSMIGQILGGSYATNVEQRLFGSLSAALYAVMAGAKIIRVHDVKETVEAIKVYKAIAQIT